MRITFVTMFFYSSGNGIERPDKQEANEDYA
jgi:hypothetical protein